jgi:hypothetical protein
MALISEYSIVTYERKPNHWRAAIIPTTRIGGADGTDQVRSIITPNDSATEADAKVAAELLIRKIGGHRVI